MCLLSQNAQDLKIYLNPINAKNQILYVEILESLINVAACHALFFLPVHVKKAHIRAVID